MEWRRATWATAGMVVFVGMLGLAATWYTAAPVPPPGHPRPFWPVYVFVVLAIAGMGLFVLAMVKPELLPDNKLATREREEEHRRQEQPHRFSRLNPFHQDPNRDLIRALDLHRHALEARNAGTGGAIPLLPPVDYQVDQLRQAIAQISDSRDDFDHQVLGSVLTNTAATREGRNPIYEPMHELACEEGLKRLVESGEIAATGSWQYQITPPSPGDTSDDDPRSAP